MCSSDLRRSSPPLGIQPYELSFSPVCLPHFTGLPFVHGTSHLHSKSLLTKKLKKAWCRCRYFVHRKAVYTCTVSPTFSWSIKASHAALAASLLLILRRLSSIELPLPSSMSTSRLSSTKLSSNFAICIIVYVKLGNSVCNSASKFDVHNYANGKI